MRRTPIVIGVLIAALALTTAINFGAQKENDVEHQLKAAMNTELVDGNLKAAIEQYKKVAESGNRPLAAQALLHMAECYQKLGDSESRVVYERIVREYADQKEAAAMASARLGAGSAPRPNGQAKGDRPVWTGTKVDPFGQVSPDGRWITYVDWSNGNIAVHDVLGDTDYPITLKKAFSDAPASGGSSVISRNGKLVAYAWSTWGDNDEHVRVYITSLEKNAHQSARFLLEAKPDVSFLNPCDWSPDGKWIAFTIEKRKDAVVQIAIASATDGSLRVLKTLDWRDPGKIFFSPDGRYIAYSAAANDGTDESDIFLIAADASRENHVIEHHSRNWPLGWSADGRLLFASDRTGAVGLWTIEIADGKARGNPELLKANIGTVEPLGITNSGVMYVFRGALGDRDTHIASIDVQSGRLLTGPTGFKQGFVEDAADPDWSPDGKFLAYSGCDGHCIVIRSADTGESRQLRTMWYARLPHWSPDGKSLVVTGRDLKGRQGVFRVDAQSGQVDAVLADGSLNRSSAEWSRDGKKIYDIRGDLAVLTEIDLESGARREIFRHPHLTQEFHLSPDGKYFAVIIAGDGTENKLLLVPAAGGELRAIATLVKNGAARKGAWLPDSSALLIEQRNVSENKRELLMFAIDGTTTRKLDIDADVWNRGSLGAYDSGFSLSPDGRRIAFLVGKRSREVWALENFLPSAKTNK